MKIIRSASVALALFATCGIAFAQNADEHSIKRTFVCSGVERSITYTYAFQFSAPQLARANCSSEFYRERTNACGGTVLFSDSNGILDGQYEVAVTNVGNDDRASEGGWPWVGHIRWGTQRVMPSQIWSSSRPIQFVTTWIDGSGEPHTVRGQCQ